MKPTTELDRGSRSFGDPPVPWNEPEQCFWCASSALLIHHWIQLAASNQFIRPPRRWLTDQEGFETCACGYSLLRGLNPQATKQ